MKMYFEDYKKVRILIGEPKDREEALNIAEDFLRKKNFKSYYYRISRHIDNVWIDYGSHYEFFVVTDPHKEFEIAGGH